MSAGSRFKQALVIRLDLGMGRGKMAVQCSHAALSAAEVARAKFRDWYEAWISEGQTKVALKTKELSSLLELAARARRIPLPAYLVRDKGLTQVPPGEVTCLGIGPAPSATLDLITGNLPLLRLSRLEGFVQSPPVLLQHFEPAPRVFDVVAKLQSLGFSKRVSNPLV